MVNFDEADIQGYYARSQLKDYETVTIAIRSRQIGRKLQARKNTAPPPGLNIAPYKDPSITSGLTQEADEDEDASLIGRSYLVLDPAGGDISLLGEEASLAGGNVYPPRDDSIGDSTEKGHTKKSRAK